MDLTPLIDGRPAGAAPADVPTSNVGRRVVLVANRLPAAVRIVSGAPVVERSIGGLATGLAGVHDGGDGVWIGWPGELPKERHADRERMLRSFAAERFVPLELSTTEVKRFYEGFANGVLWPLFHYQIDRIPLDARDFDVYRAVNEKYAAAAAQHARPGDLVWIHDYQLALVPALLRAKRPDLRIGFFLHIPFPSSEVFRVLPWRDEILRGLLGADLVGFHTFAYLRHFAVSLLRCLDLEADLDRVTYDEREVRFGVFPMGIDVGAFSSADDGAAARDIAVAVKPEPTVRILLGIDRLDYTKGIRRRLLAFGRLLEKHPEWKGRARFVQVAVPSREKVDEYARFRREVDEIVGRVNGAHGTLAGPAIHYLHRSFDVRELRALYRAADVCVVTPLRDGMNLVAKEFVASRVDDDGVLILSEFAGAASELGEALIVNPYDVDATADVYARALAMPREERRLRMRALRRRTESRDVRTWAEDFLRALASTPEHPPEAPGRLRARDAAETAAELGAAAELVVFLDYDGTLTGYRTSPELAAPDGALLLLLRSLTAAPKTAVHIVSGRRREDLQTWFAGLPLGLHAEHGAWSRLKGEGDWRVHAPEDDGWKDRVRPFLAQAAASTPGAFVEEKAAGLAWHWRAADPEFGAQQARELRLHLSDLLANSPIEVLTGEKVVEVRHHAAHKGTAVARVLRELAADVRTVAVGDDRTDEDLFRALPPGGVAVRVGRGPTRAAHRLADWREVRAFLADLAERRGG